MSKTTSQADRSRSLRIGLVQSRFNLVMSQGLTQACIGTLEQFHITEEDRWLITVPGALEIPLALQMLAGSKRFDALIALGVVIRGETHHFEIVANQSAAGMMRVSLDCGTPIVNAVLTVNTEEQAMARITDRGCTAAHTAIEMANTCANTRMALQQQL